MVTTIEYNDRDVLNKAWSAIDQRLAVDVVVRGWRVPPLRRAMPLCEAIFGDRRGERPTRPDALRLGLYGWWSASTLLGIYNYAVFTGMTADWLEVDGAIVVSFRPSTDD